MNVISFSKLMRTKMADLALSVTDVAMKSGICYSTVRNYHTGETLPKKEQYDKLNAVLYFGMDYNQMRFKP